MKARRTLVRWVATSCVVGCASSVWALPKKSEAVKLLEEGQVKYKAERFDEAIEDFKKGYEIEPDPAFLIAWAQAERQRHRCRDAVRLYQEFIATNPPKVAQEFAREGIVRCADQLAEDAEAGADVDVETDVGNDETVETTAIETDEVVDDPKPKDERRPWYRDPLGTSLVVFGVAGAGVGTGLLVFAQREENKPSEGEDYGEFEARQRRVRDLRISGGAVLGVGGALLMSGIIRWALVARKTTNASASASVGVLLGREITGLTFSGRF